MRLKNLFLPPDVFSRHQIISELLTSTQTVLDVGGSLGQLKSFLPQGTTSFTTDVIGGDVIYNGQHLPFKSKSVDAIVSIDTLEHIHSSSRLSLILEFARVAKTKIIIAAPLGTSAHLQAEKVQLADQTQTRKPDQYLVEHVRHGLPELAEIKLWLKDFPDHRIIFSGDFRRALNLFRLQQSSLNLKVIGRLWYEVKKAIFALYNLILFPLEKNLPLRQTINRFYVTINLTP